MFLIFVQKHRLSVLRSTHNLCFEQKYNKISEFYHFMVKFSLYLYMLVFVFFFFFFFHNLFLISHFLVLGKAVLCELWDFLGTFTLFGFLNSSILQEYCMVFVSSFAKQL